MLTTFAGWASDRGRTMPRRRRREVGRQKGAVRGAVETIEDLRANPVVLTTGVQSTDGADAKKVRRKVAGGGSIIEEDTTLTLVEVAAANEYGVPPRVPRRSFLRSTAIEQGEAWGAYLARSCRRYIREQDVSGLENDVRRLGLRMRADVQNKIVTLRDPPNADVTIAKKQSSNPLVDTTQLLNSIRTEARIGKYNRVAVA